MVKYAHPSVSQSRGNSPESPISDQFVHILIKKQFGLKLRTQNNIYNLKIDKNNTTNITKKSPQYFYFSKKYTRYPFGVK